MGFSNFTAGVYRSNLISRILKDAITLPHALTVNYRKLPSRRAIRRVTSSTLDPRALSTVRVLRFVFVLFCLCRVLVHWKRAIVHIAPIELFDCSKPLIHASEWTATFVDSGIRQFCHPLHRYQDPYSSEVTDSACGHINQHPSKS